MKIGLFDHANSLDGVVTTVKEAADMGFPTVWFSQIFATDTLTCLAVAGREVPGIELGTAVVPTYPRHPLMLAAQALTVQAATGNRLALGIGLSHQIVIESMFGLSFEKPARHMREYLEVLTSVLHKGTAEHKGEVFNVQATVTVPDAAPPPVLIAGLGPMMLKLAGSLADGTVTWMAGPQTLRDHITPVITQAAEAAGRPAPRIAAGLPICVTDDPDHARRRAEKEFAVYGQLPSYRAMLDREGAGGPADIAVVGDEESVRGQLDEVAAAGATDLVASVYGSKDERPRTKEFLKTLL